MKLMSTDTLAIGAAGFCVLVLMVIGAPHDRPPAPPSFTQSSAPAPSGVSGGGFTLVSQSVDLPSDDGTYPAGPHADVINANCVTCHSASMALTQPPLSPDQWKAEVTKMRETFHAPVPAGNDADIVAYLTAMPSQQTGQNQTAAPAAKPMVEDKSGGTG